MSTHLTTSVRQLRQTQLEVIVQSLENHYAVGIANEPTEICVGPQNTEPTVESSTRELSLVIECIETIEGISSIGSELDRLSSVPFLKTPWMVAWLESYRPQFESIKFLVCRNHGEPVAFLPLVLRRSLQRGRQLVFVGSGKTCADFMTIAGEAVCPKVIDTFAIWFWDNRSEWDLLELDGVQSDDSLIHSLVKNLSQKGCQSVELSALATWRTELPENWKSFETMLSKNSRKKFRRLARGLEEAGAKFRYVDDQESLEQGLSILKELHTKRWVSLGEDGCFAAPNFEKFVDRLAHAHFRQGTLRLVWLELEGQPIAADIAFVSGNGLFTYQGGIDPEQLKWEPGRAILRCQIERAMDEGLEFIDFLRGDEGYKSRWQAFASDAVRIQVASVGWRSKAIFCFLHLGRKAKRVLKNVVASTKKR